VGLFVVFKECLLILQDTIISVSLQISIHWITMRTYRSIFLHKRAESRVAQQGFVTWKLKKALLVTTQKFATEIWK